MKTRKIKARFVSLFAAAFFAFAALLTHIPQDARGEYINPYTTLRIGLYYGNDALSSANLENSVGSGFTFGYFDQNREFHAVGETDNTKLTMMKDWTMYLSGGKYYDEAPSGSFDTIGCYHIRVNREFYSFSEAKEQCANYNNSFVAFHNGTWYVCAGSYTSYSAAETAAYERGIDGTPMTASSNCVTVVATGTTEVLFQFDYGTSASLAVMPKRDESGENPQTWFKGYKYYGAFQYARLAGKNITVVNFIDIEDYVKGVVPYEMNTEWPLEALKAQAVCARTYAASHINNHGSNGFDLCNSTHCQAYRGTNAAGEGSNRAVDETAGMYLTYNGELCETYYFSSDGGATEDSENVFEEAIPYLRGVADPYEQYVETGKANWSYTYTADDITGILKLKGYNCSQIVSVTPEYTRSGNIYSLKFTDSNGKNWTFSKYNASSILYSNTYGKYTYSMHFTVTTGDGEGGTGSVYVNSAADTLDTSVPIYAIGTGGETAELPSSGSISVISSGGTESVSLVGGGKTLTGDKFVISGSGWGHNVGMSQFGAKAMAELGYSYDDILKFYYTGVTIG